MRKAINKLIKILNCMNDLKKVQIGDLVQITRHKAPGVYVGIASGTSGFTPIVALRSTQAKDRINLYESFPEPDGKFAGPRDTWSNGLAVRIINSYDETSPLYHIFDGLLNAHEEAGNLVKQFEEDRVA